MNIKMTTNSQLSTNEPKRKAKPQKQKLSKQPEQEQNQKWRSYGGSSAGKWNGKNGGKVQGIRSINGRYKEDRGRIRIV